MLKRIMAWILLVGFILLLLNIMLFQKYLVASIAIYLLIAVWFIFTNKTYSGSNNKKVEEVNSEE